MMALAGLGFTWLGLAQIIEVFKAGTRKRGLGQFRV